MSGFSGADMRAANRERAALIKRRVGVDDALEAVGLATDLGVECPVCGGIGTLREKEPPGGKGFIPRRVSESSVCGECGTEFDAISIVRAAKGYSFAGACLFLERECMGPASRGRGVTRTPAKGDAKTRRFL